MSGRAAHERITVLAQRIVVPAGTAALAGTDAFGDGGARHRQFAVAWGGGAAVALPGVGRQRARADRSGDRRVRTRCNRSRAGGGGGEQQAPVSEPIVRRGQPERRDAAAARIGGGLSAGASTATGGAGVAGVVGVVGGADCAAPAVAIATVGQRRQQRRIAAHGPHGITVTLFEYVV